MQPACDQDPTPMSPSSCQSCCQFSNTWQMSENFGRRKAGSARSRLSSLLVGNLVREQSNSYAQENWHIPMVQVSTSTLLRHGLLQARQATRNCRTPASSLQPSSTRDQSADHTALHGKILLTAGLAATFMVSNPRLLSRRSQHSRYHHYLLPVV